MSSEEQSLAIGKAIQAADASRKKVAAIEAELHDAGEKFKTAHLSLHVQMGNPLSMTARIALDALDALPLTDNIKRLVVEREEESSKHKQLEDRARILRGD